MDDSARVISAELGPDETIVWSGTPRQGLMLRSGDFFRIPFSLMWCGFAVFWEASVFRTGAPLFFRLWGVPFVLVGLHMVFGRFFVDAWTRSKTRYGVTNSRVLIVMEGSGKKVISLDRRNLDEITLDDHGDGSGTITFGSLPAFASSHRMMGSLSLLPAFVGITDARRVCAILSAPPPSPN